MCSLHGCMNNQLAIITIGPEVSLYSYFVTDIHLLYRIYIYIVHEYNIIIR